MTPLGEPQQEGDRSCKGSKGPKHLEDGELALRRVDIQVQNHYSCAILDSESAVSRTDLPETLIPVVVVGAAAFEEAGAVGSTHRVLGTEEGCGPSGFYKDQQHAGVIWSNSVGNLHSCPVWLHTSIWPLQTRFPSSRSTFSHDALPPGHGTAGGKILQTCKKSVSERLHDKLFFSIFRILLKHTYI